MPRDLSLSSSGDLLQTFAPELTAALRPTATQRVSLPDTRLPLTSTAPFAALPLPNLTSSALEIVVNFTAAAVGGGGGVSFGILFHVDTSAPFDPATTHRTAVGVSADCRGARGTRTMAGAGRAGLLTLDRKSTRLNSSHRL